MIAAALALSLPAGSHPLQGDFPVCTAPFSHQSLRQTELGESPRVRRELLTGLEEGGGSPAAPPLDLVVRPMLGHDFDSQAGEGQLLEIERLWNPSLSGNWNRDLFQGYAQMEQAIVVYDEGQ